LVRGGTKIRIDSQITFLGTADLVGTARFYEDVLGLPLVLDQGKCRIYRAARGAFVGFCQRPSRPAVEGVIITLVTREVDEYCDLLRGRGVVFEKDPAPNAEYRIYHCFLRDPNGYLVEIQRFDDPRWRDEPGSGGPSQRQAEHNM
jgi:catechol 2,3-dioxygenase-like lactoylglutathione lyase family enzyme